jgi:hypothetical protein
MLRMHSATSRSATKNRLRASQQVTGVAMMIGPVGRFGRRRWGFVLAGRATFSTAVERVGACPKCGGEDRFSINTKKQVWHCRGCDKGGDVVELVRHLDGADFKEACRTLTGETPPSKRGNGRNGRVESADTKRPQRRAAEKTAAEETEKKNDDDPPLEKRVAEKKVVVAAYEYHDADGKLAFVTERVEYQNADGSPVLNKDGKRKKTFRQKRPDPDKLGAWLWNVDGVPPIPYRLPDLVKAVGCVIVEGEAKADLLRSWNIPATCCAGGAKKWRSEHAAYLRDTDVVILPDNDEPGHEHMNLVAVSLQGIAKSVRVLELPDLPPKGDIVDWAAAGGTAERLYDLIESAPLWLPPLEGSVDAILGAAASADAGAAKEREDALLEALGKLKPGVEFARQRKRAARQFGVSAAAVDAELEARRADREDRALQPLYGHWTTDPWHEVVDGDALLRDIIRRTAVTSCALTKARSRLLSGSCSLGCTTRSRRTVLSSTSTAPSLRAGRARP